MRCYSMIVTCQLADVVASGLKDPHANAVGSQSHGHGRTYAAVEQNDGPSGTDVSLAVPEVQPACCSQSHYAGR